MTNVLSLCNDIEQFLQQSDRNSQSQFLNWLKYRLNMPQCSENQKCPCLLSKKSLINTSQLFACQCGHRYSLHFTITDDLHELDPVDVAREEDSTRSYLCTKCQMRIHSRETFLKHYAMHRQGYIFCTRCSQFYQPDEVKVHDCEQRKMDELQSLEQLIPPDTNEQQQDSSPIEYVNDPETSTSARATHFGLPKLTDSTTEVRHADGKRQFRCPICSNSYVNRSGLNRHYITHSSQDLWKVECQYCGKRYSRKDSLKHHMKTQHAQLMMSTWTWKDNDGAFCRRSNERLFQSCNNLSSNSLEVESPSSSSSIEKEQIEHDDVVSVS